MSDWFYGKDGTQHGPVSEQEMANLTASGQIDANTIIWREGMADWLPISQVPEFQTTSQQPSSVPIYAPGQATYAAAPLPAPIPTDGLSIASLVCGILALLACYIWGLFGLAAVICGHFSLSKIKNSSTPIQGKGMAIAGLICGYIGIIIQITVIIGFVFLIGNVKDQTESQMNSLKKEFENVENVEEIERSEHTPTPAPKSPKPPRSSESSSPETP